MAFYIRRPYETPAPYEVTVAHNGEEVLELFRSTTFDAILMDIQMPVMDGYCTARAIREFERGSVNGHARRTPIIALTSYAMEGDRSRCLDAGMDDYLTKPLSKPILLARLERL